MSIVEIRYELLQIRQIEDERSQNTPCSQSLFMLYFRYNEIEWSGFLGSYKSIQEASALWGCSERNVQILCKRGNIPGAKKVSGIWLLPEESVLRRSNTQNPPPAFRVERLYGRGTNVQLALHPAENRSEESGCTVTQYQILEGITLVFQDIHEERLEYGSKAPQFPSDLIAIQHCREGRFEGEYPDGECIYMGSGSLSVNLPAWSPVTNSFPLRHYYGFCIAILPDAAEAAIGRLEQILGPVHIEFSVLLEHLSEKNRLSLYVADAKINRLISSMYESYGEGRDERLRVQALELLQLLSTQKVLLPDSKQYFPREQVTAIKELHQYLISHLDQHIPLPELANRFQLSLTGMKVCFKGVYGQPIGKYLREYRMQAGAEKLRNTKLKIIEIAASLGYENSSKFSEAFSACYEMTPSAYRKSFCPQGGTQSGKELK